MGADTAAGGGAPALVHVRVDGKPIAQPRPTVRVLGSKASGGARGQAYVPASHPVHAWRLAVARAARRAFADLGALGIAFDGVVRIDALIVLPRPSTLLRRADTDDLLWAPKRPDRDNIVKALQDALVVGVLDEAGRCVSRGVLSDDSCVVCGEALKTYAERGEQPRVELLLSVEQRSPRQVWDELCAGVSSRLGVAIPTQRSRRSTDPRQPPTPSTQTALGI